MKRSRLIRMLTAATTAALVPSRIAAAPEPLCKHLAVGKPLPHFRTTARDGSVLHLPAADGRATVLAFWSPVCACNENMPALLQTLNRSAGGVLIVGLDIGRDAQSDAEIAAARVTFPIANLSFEDAQQFFRGGYGLPQAMLIDRSGVLREIVIGADRSDHLAHRIAALG